MGQVLSLSPQRTHPNAIFGSALVRRLIDYAAHLTGTTAEELVGHGRLRRLVWTRWAVCVVARERGRTLPQIADCFDRDHTTIIHGLRTAKTIRDDDFDELLRLLREEAAR